VLKLRYLFNNVDLAEMLLGNWEYDPPASQLFEYFRISANATYPFRQGGQTCFLRFCPVIEKSWESVAAELEFIHYLRANGYNALEPVPSKSGDALLHKETPWGAYLATAFKRAKGERMDEVELDDEVTLIFGKSLGTLHRLSRQYGPTLRRWSYADALDWSAQTLRSLEGQERALAEVMLLTRRFASLPKDANSYGLVHYDFELDNVFFDAATRTCSVIDFDDAMYHWYAVDIDQTLDSLADRVSEADFERVKAVVLDGYRQEFPLEEDMLARLPAFRRFVNLYGYTRMLRSVQETWDNEPEWMRELRDKLAMAMRNRCARFGTPVEH
jgi:Ser/Thr protein kinase RdoA (MazF antagonist)